MLDRTHFEKKHWKKNQITKHSLFHTNFNLRSTNVQIQTYMGSAHQFGTWQTLTCSGST